MWLMDDDTIPAAARRWRELLEAPSSAQPEARRPCSPARSLWRDGRVHPMNFPAPERRSPEPHGRGRRARPHAAAARRPGSRCSCTEVRWTGYGLPLKHFFIWSDDIEYTGTDPRRASLATSSRPASWSTGPRRPTMRWQRRPIASTFTCATRCSSSAGPGRAPRERLVLRLAAGVDERRLPHASSQPRGRSGDPARPARRAPLQARLTEE